jgi:hypothetical protein
MNTLILKLQTSEDVMSEIESESETEYVLFNPVIIAVMPNNDGKPNVEFLSFPLHSEAKKDKTYCLPKKAVVYSYEPGERYIENYKKIFSEIITASKQELIID